MPSLVDTSVFVAGMIPSHTHHASSLSLIQKFHKGHLQGLICAHSLAEFYSVLTAYPIRPRISGEIGERLVVENILPHFEIISLSKTDYLEAIKRVKTYHLQSGAIFDALILQAALKGKATSLYTWDKGDFERMIEDEIEILEP